MPPTGVTNAQGSTVSRIDIMHIIVIDIMHIIVIVPSVSCACSHARLSVGEDGRGQSALSGKGGQRL